MKLNPLIKEEEEEEDGGRNLVKERTTGEETNGVVGGGAKDTASGMKAEDFDWSQPLSMPEEPKLELDFNISPVSSPSSSIHASQNLSKADEESKVICVVSSFLRPFNHRNIPPKSRTTSRAACQTTSWPSS